MKKSLVVQFVICISLVLTACGGSGPLNPSGYPSSVLFVETWESYSVGDFPGGGWQDSGGSYFQKEVDIPSNHKFLLHGPDDRHPAETGGIHYLFKPGTMKPTYIAYKVHPYPNFDEIEIERAFIGKFLIKGYLPGTDHKVSVFDIDFYHEDTDLGFISINGDAYPGSSSQNRISIDQSFHFEIRNVLWNSPNNPTFDLWINGYEIQTCLQFNRDVDSISMISLLNKDYGRVHFDDIYMADLPVEYHCPVVSENPPGPDTMPLPPPPSPTYTRVPIIFILHTPAFCRMGPGTDYPKLTTFPEDTQLVITGQNLEGTWWWSEEAECWISGTVGEVQGNPRFLEVIIPPPPPEPDTADGEPGKPSGCHSGMGQEACEANGGTWVVPLVEAPYCSCP
jgi:hypothetical protein